MAADKLREDQLQAVWFAAGTAAFIACIERAVVESLFAHWRVWAFLALNLLLLAILFTSKSQIRPSSEVDAEDDGDSELIQKKGKQEALGSAVSVGGETVMPPPSDGAVEVERKNIVEEDVQEEAQEQISKEELNERVEAFIAMFRQHLVSDAKSFRTRERLNHRSLQTHKYVRA